MYKHKNSSMERIKYYFDFVKRDIIENKVEYKNFLFVMLLFNFFLVGIAELTIMHPPEFIKQYKYNHKKSERRIEKRDH